MTIRHTFTVSYPDGSDFTSRSCSARVNGGERGSGAGVTEKNVCSRQIQAAPAQYRSNKGEKKQNHENTRKNTKNNCFLVLFSVFSCVFVVDFNFFYPFYFAEKLL